MSWNSAYANTGPSGEEIWRSGTPARVYAPLDGIFLVTWAIRWQVYNVTSERLHSIDTNGVLADYRGVVKDTIDSRSTDHYYSSALALHLAKGDYITLRIFQNAGAQLVIEPVETWSCFLTFNYLASAAT